VNFYRPLLPNFVGTRETERLLTSFHGSSGPSVLNFIVNLISAKRKAPRAFRLEGRLATEKGNERLTYAGIRIREKCEKGNAGEVTVLFYYNMILIV